MVISCVKSHLRGSHSLSGRRAKSRGPRLLVCFILWGWRRKTGTHCPPRVCLSFAKTRGVPGFQWPIDGQIMKGVSQTKEKRVKGWRPWSMKEMWKWVHWPMAFDHQFQTKYKGNLASATKGQPDFQIWMRKGRVQGTMGVCPCKFNLQFLYCPDSFWIVQTVFELSGQFLDFRTVSRLSGQLLNCPDSLWVN